MASDPSGDWRNFSVQSTQRYLQVLVDYNYRLISFRPIARTSVRRQVPQEVRAPHNFFSPFLCRPRNGGTAARYQLRTLPTVLVFKGGEVVEQKVGVAGKAELQEMLDSHL